MSPDTATSGAASGSRLVLTLSCPDRPGIVHAVSGFLVRHGCNILESQQFGDTTSGTFFMRVEFAPEEPATDAIRDGFGSVASEFAMTWTLNDRAEPTRVLVLVSRQLHCLNDLLFRSHSGALPIEIVAVVSNHDDARPLAESYRLPFHRVGTGGRSEAEARIRQVAADLNVELVVLARYMQILSGGFCEHFAGRIINIHHSFLPSFKGARPYHQAHERGVKLIGATAHYATADLDEGPIIEQDVIRVDHADGPAALAAVGRDVEAQVLARAVAWHAEHRILINGHRTVVFA